MAEGWCDGLRRRRTIGEFGERDYHIDGQILGSAILRIGVVGGEVKIGALDGAFGAADPEKLGE